MSSYHRFLLAFVVVTLSVPISLAAGVSTEKPASIDTILFPVDSRSAIHVLVDVKVPSTGTFIVRSVDDMGVRETQALRTVEFDSTGIHPVILTLNKFAFMPSYSRNVCEVHLYAESRSGSSCYTVSTIYSDGLKSGFSLSRPVESMTFKPAESLMMISQPQPLQRIDVRIRGRVVYDYCPQGNCITKGVPELSVYMDWDGDPDDALSWLPPGVPSSPVTTDLNGNYEFNFSFYHDDDVNKITNLISIRAKQVNPAAYINALGDNAVFAFRPVVDVSTSTTSINATATDIVSPMNEGEALRNLWYSKAFSLAHLGYDPYGSKRIGVLINVNANHSQFCAPGNNCDGNTESKVRILFDEVPVSELAGHEYGHYVQWAFQGGTTGGGSCPDPHNLRVASNSGCAWREGFAEFFSSAANEWLYDLTLPAVISDEQFDSRMRYTFLDAGQSIIPVQPHPGETEGGVAVFFHNLWDHTDFASRSGTASAVPYSGDNEDLWIPRFAILQSTRLRYNVRGQLQGRDNLDAYHNGLRGQWRFEYPITWRYWVDSQDDMYTHIGPATRVQRSATPEKLTVSETFTGQHRLNWIDLTEPGNLIMNRETRGFTSVPNLVNNETQFRIYRRKLNENEVNIPWDGRDGRLDPRYTLIHQTGPDIEEAVVPAPPSSGTYSYVVVAWNSSGGSIPRAEARIKHTSLITLAWDPRFGLQDFQIAPGFDGTIECNSDNPNVSYHWAWGHKPDYVIVSGETTNRLTLFNAYNGSQSLHHPRMWVQCIVTDTSSLLSDTTDKQYPLLIPRDSLPNLVNVATSYNLGAPTYEPEKDLYSTLRVLYDQGVDVPTVRILETKPVLDSSTFSYRIFLAPFTEGLTSVDQIMLIGVNHVDTLELDGNIRDGFYLVDPNADTMTIVERFPFSYRLPLASALVGPMQVKAQVMDVDATYAVLGNSDTLALTFDASDTIYLNMPDSGYTRSFLLFMTRRYNDSVSGSDPSSSVSWHETSEIVLKNSESVGQVVEDVLELPEVADLDGECSAMFYNAEGRSLFQINDIGQGHQAGVDVSSLISGSYVCVVYCRAGIQFAVRFIKVD